MSWFTKWLMKENDTITTSRKVSDIISSYSVVELKVPLISEPVLSLIESLENREWSFSHLEAVFGFAMKCSHFRKKLKFTAVKSEVFQLFPTHTTVYEFSCREDWMTKDEGEAVSRTVFKVIEEENKEWQIANNYKEREKFMSLVKEKQK